jgi:nitrogenase molybdenum-iron protein alpha/beta subunit
MVTDEALEKALDYLRDTAESAAQARANRLYLDDYSRVLKASLMAEHLAEAVNAQERYAYSDIRYRNHLEGLKVAIYEDEKARYLREAAQVKISVWQSEHADQRRML